MPYAILRESRRIGTTEESETSEVAIWSIRRADMPSRKGRRAKPILTGVEAIAALEHLAAGNPDLATVINELGRRILDLPGVQGLRDGRDGETYDVSFVSAKRTPGAFATFTTPSYRGTWKRNEAPSPGALLVEVRVNPVSSITDNSHWLRPKQFAAQGGGGWHNGYVNAGGREMDTAFRVIEQAYYSWN